MSQKRKFEQTNLKTLIREKSRIIVDQTIREEELKAQKIEDEAKTLLDRIVEHLSEEHARRVAHKISAQTHSHKIIESPKEVFFQVFGDQPAKVSKRVVQLLEEHKIRARHECEERSYLVNYVKVDISSIDED